MLTFNDFRPGRPLGSAALVFDEAAAQAWTELFPHDARWLPQMPPAMVAMITMRAYTQAVAPRPKGNIHGRQVFELHRAPQLGTHIVTEFTCVGKQLKRGRRWVSIRSASRDAAGSLLFGGEMSLVWAA